MQGINSSKFKSFLGLGLFFLMIHLVAVQSPADEELDRRAAELAREIKQLKNQVEQLDKEISTTDSAKRAEATRAERASKTRQEELQRRQQEIEALRDKIESRERENAGMLAQASTLRNKAESIKARHENLRKVLIKVLDSIEVRIASSIPWDTGDRLDNIQALRRDLESGTASPSEGVQRLLALVQSEIDFVDEIELASRPITLQNGDVVNAQVMRLGAQWAVYMDEEEKAFGIMQRQYQGDSLQFSWNEDLDINEINAVRKAIEIKQAKRPPQLIELPLSFSLEEETK